MAEVILEVVTQLIKICSIYLCMQNVALQETNKKFDVLVIAGLVFLHLGFSADDWRGYVFENFLSFLLFLIMTRQRKMQIKLSVIFLSCLLLVQEMINIFTSVAVVFIVYLCSRWLSLEAIERELMAGALILVRTCVMILLLKAIENKSEYFEKILKEKYVFVPVYFLMIVAKIPFLYSELEEHKNMKGMTVAIVVCTLIFLFVLSLEKYKTLKEKMEIEEKNKLLSYKLHKSQEVLPAMVQVLTEISKNDSGEVDNIKMKEENLQQLLTEVKELYRQKTQENACEDMALKSFCSTGLVLLDQQLMIYQMPLHVIF